MLVCVDLLKVLQCRGVEEQCRRGCFAFLLVSGVGSKIELFLLS